MKPVEQWTPGRRLDALTGMAEARRKYLRLGREIASGAAPGDLDHTHSKLGIFLTEVLGENWTEWLTGDPDAEMKEAFGG